LFTWLEGLHGTGFVSERGMAGVVRTATVAVALDALDPALAAPAVPGSG
jgi:hypothetical protein